MSTRVIVTPDENGNNPSVQIAGSSIMQPVDIQNHLQTTIQTHVAVSIPLSSSSTNANWVDSNGYDKLSVTLISDSSTTNNALTVQWSNDGATVHGTESLLSTTNGSTRTGITDTKARYFKLQVWNSDAAAAHTMSAWAYLKA